MGIKRWPNFSGTERVVSLGRSSSVRSYSTHKDLLQAKTRWRTFWRKIMGDGKRSTLFSGGGSVTFRASYDPDTYLKNFDHGTAFAEPDMLSRSFSARFSDPSRKVDELDHFDPTFRPLLSGKPGVH